MNDQQPLRVVVVDDHPAFRAGLASLLDSVAGVRVVGEAADGAASLDAVAELQPDVVLMDLHMPGVNGIQATRQLTEQHPDVAVVALTMVEDDESVFAAMRAGARGYLLKGADQDDILRAIRSAAAGDVIFGGVIAQRVIGFMSDQRPNYPQRSFPQLTERETEILDRIARGERNTEIARGLDIAEKTVRNHVSNIFTKLRVADRAAAIVRAREAGLGRGPDQPTHAHDGRQGEIERGVR
jgi:DNA-binding NarL/FixJ family response regulator